MFKRLWFYWKVEIVLLAMLCLFVGAVTCNSNTEFDKKQVPILSPSADRFRIITDTGECWVVTSNEIGVTEVIFHGDSVGECKMYLKNPKSGGD